MDEHAWRHTRRGEKYVTVNIDLTGARDRTGPARLFDLVEGRSQQAFMQSLAERTQTWREGVEAVGNGADITRRLGRGLPSLLVV